MVAMMPARQKRRIEHQAIAAVGEKLEFITGWCEKPGRRENVAHSKSAPSTAAPFLVDIGSLLETVVFLY